MVWRRSGVQTKNHNEMSAPVGRAKEVETGHAGARAETPTSSRGRWAVRSVAERMRPTEGRGVSGGRHTTSSQKGGHLWHPYSFL
jgi:hypothetical protein